MSHIGVNLLWLVPGEVGGTEAYATRLLRALAAREHRFDLTLYALPGFPAAHPDIAGAMPIVTAPVAGGRRPARVAAEWSWLTARARRVDLLHHLGGTAPLASPTPSALTIHDLQYLTYPTTFSASKLAFLRAVVPRAARRARVVMTPSDYVRGTVVERLGVNEERVVVVPLPVDVSPPEPTPSDVIRRRLDLGDRPFFLYPAITYPHKNHVVLVEALARLSPSHSDVVLVLTGNFGSAEAELRAATDRLGVGDRVRRTGRVPAADLEGLYREATAVLWPSWYEGFGAGVLEAMVRGCPVVVSGETALPEVVGDAGLIVPADAPDGWVVAMCAMLEDGAARARLADAGRERAAAFGPDPTVARLEAVYDQALETNPR